MAKTFGDESGLLWQKEVYVGRSASKETLRGPKLPDPTNYIPPDYRSIEGCSRIALDIETNDPKLESKGPGVYRGDGNILGVAIDYDDGDRRYYPLRHATGTNLNEEEFLKSLRRDAKSFKGILVNANIQYDLDWLGSSDVTFDDASFFDVQFAEPLLDENLLTYSLESIAQRHLGRGKETTTLEQNYGEDYIKHLRDIHPHYVGEYACGDVYLPLEIMNRQTKLLEQQGLTELCQIENGLIPLLLQMRSAGVPVDIDAAERARTKCDSEVIEISKRIRDIAGFEVEINSASSIAAAFDKLGMQYPVTAKGQPSFRRDWLENHTSKLANLITEQRRIEKVSGTFLRNYILEGSVNNRIHCMFNPLRSDGGGTVSGRFSSAYPNLQNIPARDGVLGPMCRSIFVPEKEHDWGCIDWSQIEFRFLVHYAVAAKCKGADKAAQMYLQDRNTDFHAMAAAIVSQGKEFTKAERDGAKTINFGVVYGLGKEGLANNLGVTIEEAEPILAEFHTKLPWLKQIYKMASDQASSKGFIKTIKNRRRRFNVWERGGYDTKREYIQDNVYQSLELKDRRGWRRAFTHKALNALLQGSAADLMKASMVKAYKAGVFKTLIPHLTVHDELDVSVPRTVEGKEAFNELIHIMENTMPLNVPVIASANTGTNWYDAK